MIINKQLHQVGDTLVEVIIAVGIVSLVLTGTLAITTRTLSSVHQAHEHTEALKYAESQLEQLRYRLADVQDKIFCIDKNGAVKPANAPSSADFGTFPALGADTLTNYSTDCQYFKVAGGTTYYIGIDREDADKLHKYTVHVRWLNNHGNGNDELSLEYIL